MKEFTLDPATMPEARILELAQSGFLVRAERETPENGVPAFMTAGDWSLLEARFAQHQEPAQGLLSAVEHATRRLMGHAAETLASREPGEVSATLSLTTDLFEDNAQTYLSFLRDSTYPVACVVIGSRPWSAQAPA